MKALHILKKKPESDLRQLQMETINAFELENRKLLTKKHFPYFWRNAALAALVTTLAVGTGLLWPRSEVESAASRVILFEVKVLTPDRHPAAGTAIHLRDRHIGTTDTFGEWRRYIKVNPSQKLTLRFLKKTDQARLSSVYNFQIPASLDQNSPWKYRQTISLQKNAVFNMPAVDEQNQAVAKNSPLAAVSNGFDMIWFKTLDQKTQETQGELLKYLKQRAKSLGLGVERTSAWQVALQSVGDDLLRIVSDHPKSDHRIDFLRNTGSDPRKIGRSILWGLRLHTSYPYSVETNGGRVSVRQPETARGLWQLRAGRLIATQEGQLIETKVHDTIRYPETVEIAGDYKCAEPPCQLYLPSLPKFPPVKDWESMRIVVSGSDIKHLNVFVSGYKATKKGNYWQFWGQPDAVAKVTIIRDSEVIFRKSLRHSKAVATFVTLPGSTMATSRR